eukprot:GHRR01012114.1.p2 GENE.GHRR01012114.1~~GHRR01012114.1.p2  ORF type:complete len:150 (-),score=9.91 GHRR01012114.1:673-1122(-)
MTLACSTSMLKLQYATSYAGLICLNLLASCPAGCTSTPSVCLSVCADQVRDMLLQVTGESYDSVLINYYPDGKCGMRFHTDPLYGKWTSHTSVASLGSTRRFVFRKIDDHSVRWTYRYGIASTLACFTFAAAVVLHPCDYECHFAGAFL